MVTVYLYFVGVRYLEFKYPDWLMEDCWRLAGCAILSPGLAGTSAGSCWVFQFDSQTLLVF